MSREEMLISLVVVTLVAAMAWAVWQKWRTKKSQQKSGDPEGRKATNDALHSHTPDR